MRPTLQPHQQNYRQEGWSSQALQAAANTTPPSSALHVPATHIPLLPGGPARPPPRPIFMDPSSAPPSSPLTPYDPSSFRTESRPSSVHHANHASNSQFGPPTTTYAPAFSSRPPLGPRLSNPYEQREQSRTSNTVPHVPPSRHGATRLSFGPGDPLFSHHGTSVNTTPPPRFPPSPGPAPTSHPAQPSLPSTPPPRVAQRASSSSSTRSAAAQHTPSTTTAHEAPGHEFDDCPGCRAEMEDAIKASLQSAEHEARRRQQLEQQELDRVSARTAEENERRRRLADEEEQLLQRALEDSRREAELQSQRATQDEALLMEESRQDALRQREHDARLEAEMMEAAKLASTTHEQHRRQELDAMHQAEQQAEQQAVQLSLQEQEDEWARRESAERSLLEFLDQRSFHRSTTPLSSGACATSASTAPSNTLQTPRLPQASSSSVASDGSTDHNLEAEYWRFAGHDEAYTLALRMQQASLLDSHPDTPPGPSTLRARRPLPQTPQPPDGNADVGELVAGADQKHDTRAILSNPAHAHDLEDAPPAYAEALQSQSSKPGSRSSENAARRSPKKSSLTQYDTETLHDLSRPVLQPRASSSSSSGSGLGHLGGPSTSLSSEASTGVVPNLSSPSLTALCSAESSPMPHATPASPSIPERGSSQTTLASKRSSGSGSPLTSDQRGQRALAGIEFGYSSLPFASTLDKTRLPSAQSSSTTAPGASIAKTLFPASIELFSVTKTPLESGSRFFVIRAYSWKSLLRAIAWYGNSRVEAAPEEVAAASDRRSRCLLRAEVEFVTPTRFEPGFGVAEYARAAQSTGSMPKNPSPAHVALCLSLLPMGEASAWLKTEEYHAMKRESRRLDAWYAGKGSTRRLIQLAREPPALPVALVQVAQLLHASHTFSAACPSSGSTARHSPRDLHHAIERHDQGFVRKQKAILAAGSALASQSSGLASTSSLASSNPRKSLQGPGRSSGSTDLPRDADDDVADHPDDDQDDEVLDFNDFSLLEHGITADGSFDAQDKVLMGKRERLKAKVKRRLAKRASDGRVVDEDLATWITPFDLSQHG